MKVTDVEVLLESGLPLPKDVTAAAAAAALLQSLTVPAAVPKPTEPRQVQGEVVNATVVAAGKGRALLPDAQRVAEARKALEAWQEAEEVRRDQQRLLAAAQTEARAVLAAVLAEEHEPVIRVLAVELDGLLEEVRTLAPLVRGFTPGSALRASEEVRSAWTRFDELAGRYSAIRKVQQLASVAAGGTRLDEEGIFVTFRNMPVLHPDNYVRMYAAPPWPTGDVRAFLLWCVDNPDYVLWCPTPAERDAESERVLGRKVAGMMGRRAVGV